MPKDGAGHVKKLALFTCPNAPNICQLFRQATRAAIDIWNYYYHALLTFLKRRNFLSTAPILGSSPRSLVNPQLGYLALHVGQTRTLKIANHSQLKTNILGKGAMFSSHLSLHLAMSLCTLKLLNLQGVSKRMTLLKNGSFSGKNASIFL